MTICYPPPFTRTRIVHWKWLTKFGLYDVSFRRQVLRHPVFRKSLRCRWIPCDGMITWKNVSHMVCWHPDGCSPMDFTLYVFIFLNTYSNRWQWGSIVMVHDILLAVRTHLSKSGEMSKSLCAFVIPTTCMNLLKSLSSWSYTVQPCIGLWGAPHRPIGKSLKIWRARRRTNPAGVSGRC